MIKEIESVDKILEKIFRPIGQVGILAIVAMMLVVVFDVVGRYFFNRPIIGATEIVQILNILLSFFALIWCTLEKEHIKVDILENIIPPKVKKPSDTVYYLLGVGFYSLICIQNAKITYGYFFKEGKTVVLGIPLLPVYSIISITCGCVAILLLFAVIRNVFMTVNK